MDHAKSPKRKEGCRARQKTDQGSPAYDHANAQYLADMGVPVFACTPDKFPDLMAAALSKQDVGLWAAKEDLVLKR